MKAVLVMKKSLKRLQKAFLQGLLRLAFKVKMSLWWNIKMHKTASYYPQETDNTAGEADVHKHRGLYVNTGAITAILQM